MKTLLNIQHPTSNIQGGQSGPDLVLKVTLTPGEFEMVRWAQRLCRRSRARRQAVGIAEFSRGALLDAVGQTISEVLARPGGFVPPDVARTWEEIRGGGTSNIE